MTYFIILSGADVLAVRGPTSPGAALDPIRLADGETWVLPASVLADPAHEIHHAALAALLQREILPGEWPVSEE